MPVLHIALQEGFLDDTVEIHVDGREVFRKEGVTTRLQLGKADSFETTLEGDPATVRVTLPAKDVSETIVVPEVSSTVYLAVSIENGKVGHRISSEPFGYL